MPITHYTIAPLPLLASKNTIQLSAFDSPASLARIRPNGGSAGLRMTLTLCVCMRLMHPGGLPCCEVTSAAARTAAGEGDVDDVISRY